MLYVCIYVAPWSCEARHFVPLYVPTCSGMTIKLNLNLNLKHDVFLWEMKGGDREVDWCQKILMLAWGEQLFKLFLAVTGKIILIMLFSIYKVPISGLATLTHYLILLFHISLFNITIPHFIITIKTSKWWKQWNNLNLWELWNYQYFSVSLLLCTFSGVSLDAFKIVIKEFSFTMDIVWLLFIHHPFMKE